jgi:hypothetical protein
MKSRQSTCSCGQLTITCEGEPVRSSMCHCTACQKRTGNPFGVQARFPRDRTKVEGHATAWVRTGDSGNTLTYHFCPTCGATVYYELDDIPGFVGVPVGGFADPSFPPPTVSVFGDHRYPWTEMPALRLEEDRG